MKAKYQNILDEKKYMSLTSFSFLSTLVFLQLHYIKNKKDWLNRRFFFSSLTHWHIKFSVPVEVALGTAIQELHMHKYTNSRKNVTPGEHNFTPFQCQGR